MLSQLDGADGHGQTTRLKLRAAMGRRCQRIDQQLPGALTVQTLELLGVNDDNRIAAMQRDVLRPGGIGQPNKLTEASLSVLQAPAVFGALGQYRRVVNPLSSHAD